ncbi:MAG: hypothetical protein ACI8WT_001035 [Clostridium sp.]|jgi:hypothetical protein
MLKSPIYCTKIIGDKKYKRIGWQYEEMVWKNNDKGGRDFRFRH